MLTAKDVLNKDDLIVITGAGGFIGGSLARYYHHQRYTRIRAIDKKPLPDWYQHVPGVECLSMDLSEKQNAIRAVEGAVEVYNLAADWAGWASLRDFASSVCGAYDQYTYDRGSLSRWS